MNNARVYVAYILQPHPQTGLSRLEVFTDRDRAVAFLKSEFDGFHKTVPAAAVHKFATDIGDNLAVGVIQAGFTSWSGRVVARDLDGPHLP